MRIDSHQHFWNYDPEQYPWIQSGWPIRRDFLPADLEPELKAAGFDGCIAVQARQTLEETEWLLELADNSPIIKGVVGWVDLRSPTVEDQLRKFVGNHKLVGVRHVVQDEPDDHFMLREDFLRGIGKLKQFKLTYDILIYPKQLPAAIELAKLFPQQTFVLDHIAKPLIRDQVLEPWASQIRELAKRENVYCKISGMVTEARWNQWQPGDFKPYLDVVWEAFGENRLMVGSDWPVCLNSATYCETMKLTADYFGAFSEGAKARIYGDNAVTAYDRLSKTKPL